MGVDVRKYFTASFPSSIQADSFPKGNLVLKGNHVGIIG